MTTTDQDAEAEGEDELLDAEEDSKVQPVGRFRPDYDTLRAMASRGYYKDGIRYKGVAALLAISESNDPFYAGVPSRRAKAEWFAGLWQQYGSHGAHLRRVHYQCVSQPVTPLMPDGTPYRNNTECWGMLLAASLGARQLGLVDAGAFVDQRNPEVRRYRMPRMWAAEPRATFDGIYATLDDKLAAWTLPAIPTDLMAGLALAMPVPQVDGYDYEVDDQPTLLEVWVEKSTMDDVLGPVCQAQGANLQVGMGYLSMTAVLNMLKRVAAHGKPARIFYISDHDPAGDNMPVAIARACEFWLDKYAPGADVKITPIALTAAQVTQYDLPRAPIKASDASKDGFEAKYGTGAVELDALEALHPGVLRSLVAAALAPYVDRRLPGQLAITADLARQAATAQWRKAGAAEAAELKAIEKAAATVAKQYQAKLEEMAEELEAKMAPLALRLAQVRHATAARAEEFEAVLPPRPQGEQPHHDEGDWLYHSGRHYLAQLQHYKRRGTT